MWHGILKERGRILLSSSGLNEEEIFERVIDFGGEDLINSGDFFEIITNAEDLEGVRLDIEKVGYEINSFEISMIPKIL